MGLRCASRGPGRWPVVDTRPRRSLREFPESVIARSATSSCEDSCCEKYTVAGNEDVEVRSVSIGFVGGEHEVCGANWRTMCFNYKITHVAYDHVIRQLTARGKT